MDTTREEGGEGDRRGGREGGEIGGEGWSRKGDCSVHLL